MNRYLHLAIALILAALALPQRARAQDNPEPPGTIYISNTNQFATNNTFTHYGARVSFAPGYDPSGYNLTGFSMLLGDNTAADYTNVTVLLYSSNDPNNIEQTVGTYYFDTPKFPGLYSFDFGTNVPLPGSRVGYPLEYYILDILPTYQTGSTYPYLNVDYTTDTNYDYLDNWTFYPNSASIDGTLGKIPMVNLFAVPVPPPILYPIILTNVGMLPDKTFQCGFSNSPGFNFSVYASTNVALPFTNWFYLDTPTYLGTNYYQFQLPPLFTTNAGLPRLYFRITSP